MPFAGTLGGQVEWNGDDSSMAEPDAVNVPVAGSSPVHHPIRVVKRSK